MGRGGAAAARFFFQPLDAYSLRVQYATGLAAPYQIHFIDRQVSHGCVAPLNACKIQLSRFGLFLPVLDMRIALQLRTTSGHTVGEMLDRWGIPRSISSPIKCLALPKPIAQLVARGAWSEIICLCRWLRDFSGGTPFWTDFPSQEFIRTTSGLHASVHSSLTMTPASMDSIAADLIDVGRVLSVSGTVSESVTAGAREKLLRGILALRTWSRQMTTGSESMLEARTYTAATMFRAIQASTFLKGGAARLVEAVKASLQLLFPSDVVAQLSEGLDSGRRH